MDFSGRLHPGLFPYSAPVGSTLDTVYVSIWSMMFRLQNCGGLRSCSSFLVVDIPFVTQRLIFLGSVQQTRVSQLPFIDKVFDVPFVQVNMSALSRRRG